MKKTAIMFALVVVLAGLVAAATYTFTPYNVSFDNDDGLQTVQGVRTIKPIAFEGYGVLPADGTVTVSRVVGSVTNQLVTATATDGYFSVTVTNKYIVHGDVLYRSGNATNGVVRFICEGE
jgi:hypothetical protein